MSDGTTLKISVLVWYIPLFCGYFVVHGSWCPR